MENLKEIDHVEERGLEGRNIKLDFQEVGWRAQTGLIWVRIGTGNELMWVWY